MIGIIEYGAGNLYSLTASLERLGVSYQIVSAKEDISDKFSRFIVPGVGHAASAKEKMINKGLWDVIPTIKLPVLGICVGMQLMTSYSEEGNVNLLDIVSVKTKKITPTANEKVPHMGWNQVVPINNSPLFENLGNNINFYFVHSYRADIDERYTIGKCNYIDNFSAAIQKDNFFGVQFHPEKSGDAGLKLLSNFTTI